jgi:transcriptional antiterminator NusG
MSKQQTTGERSWYVIHTYAGYENAVMRNLKQRVESLGMEDKIFNVIVPTEKKVKVKGGKRVEEEEKIYPGYILVDMIVTDDSWFVVRNTPRVTGFVGSGIHPVPLDKKEADAIERQEDVKNIRIPLEVLGNAGFIPLYKDIRKTVMNNIYKDLKNPPAIEQKVD